MNTVTQMSSIDRLLCPVQLDTTLQVLQTTLLCQQCGGIKGSSMSPWLVSVIHHHDKRGHHWQTSYVRLAGNSRGIAWEEQVNNNLWHGTPNQGQTGTCGGKNLARSIHQRPSWSPHWIDDNTPWRAGGDTTLTKIKTKFKPSQIVERKFTQGWRGQEKDTANYTERQRWQYPDIQPQW